MSNYHRGSIQASGRVGRQFPKVEYVNRSGQQVNPHTGKVVGGKVSRFGNKPYTRPVNNGFLTAKNRKPFPIKRSGAMFGNLKAIPTDPNIDPPPRACFNCWQSGHRRKDCQRPVVDRFCNNCGRRNEDLRSCPRCSEAHKLWLEMIQAKARGEEVDEMVFMTADDEADEEIQEVNDPDEILQELIYQDQKTREILEYQQRKREEREALKALYKNKEFVDERGLAIDDKEVYVRERIADKPYRNGRESSYGKKRETFVVDERDPFLDRDPFIDRELFEQESSIRDQHKSSQQERHIGMTVYKERESYDEQGVEPGYSGGYRDREERTRTPEPPRLENNWHKAMTNASTVSNSSDPVQDILLLAKTISHLSSETQDMIMRQVIAERQEQTRRRAATQENQDSPW